MAWGNHSDAALRRWAMAAFAFVSLVSVTSPFLARGVRGHAPRVHPDAALIDWGDPFFCVLMAGSGLLILWYRPRHAVGWVLLASGAAEALCTFGQTYGARAFVFPDEGLPFRTVALQLSAPLWLVAVFLPATSMLLRYPSGHVEGRWARRVERAVLVGLALLYVGYATADHSVTDEIEGHLPVVSLPEVVSGILMGACALLIVPGALFTLVHTVRRTWRASYPERQQLAWLLTFVPAAVVLLFTPWAWTQRLFWGIPLAVVIGVLRYGLAGIEVVVRRTLLYGTLTGLVLLVFVAITASLSSVMPSGAGPEVLAAGFVAIGVVPLRDRLQRGVDRFVYGDRGDPLAALTRLGTPLGLAADEALVPEVLSAVTASLRVPGAEIVGEGGTRATVGLVGENPVEVPLVMGGADVGVLRLAPRAGEKELPAADRRLLEGLAPLVAAVLHAVELADALRVEQERVVAATETERARLRQELHDGLGPSLTGIGLGLEALESRVGASDLVTRLRDETSSSLDEVRRIIDGLRPGALETADLLSLLRIRAQHLSTTTGVRVTVEAPGRLPVLPAPVETAALRIVDEALTNVVRHAGATTCTVTVSLGDALHLEVRDDGRGYAGPRPGGVGVDSMRLRAERLGGSCEVAGTSSGTVVTAELPLIAVPAVRAG
jgi:signal transduction histidine kinase